MKITSGLAEGQVLQRVGSRGASVRLQLVSKDKGALFATISKGSQALKGWKRRAVGKSSATAQTIKLEGIPAGGPYRLQIECGKDKGSVASFYVGDVWIMAGQSNMQGIADMTGAAKPHPLVRAFSMAREWRLAEDPLHLLSESPDQCHNEGNPSTAEEAEKYRRTTVKGVGVGVFFGREMLERSGVPQGLLCTAHGGTSMSQWDPALKHQGGDSQYGSMLLSIKATGQPVAGMLWYQGESDSNVANVGLYTERMKKLVAASRRDLAQPNLPWFVVQISRVFGGNQDSVSWNSIQEQERRLPEKIRNLETISAIDLSMDDSIHIGAEGYPILAARLARAADLLVYKNKKEKRPPQLKSITPNPPGIGLPSNALIDVEFDHVVGGLQSKGLPNGFSLIDADGKDWPQIFKITLHGNIARLHLAWTLPHGIKLHYGYGAVPICNITDGRNYSLPVFGPVEILKPLGFTPFITTWKVSDVVSTDTPIEKLSCPDPDAYGAQVKSYTRESFINEHANWEKKSGQVYFSAKFTLDKAMKLQFLMGYDGPFRVWLNGESFFQDLAGINPARVDESGKTRLVPAGTHQITIAMDINKGRAWGFFFRFCRLDVTQAQIRTKDYAVPTYSV